MVTTSHPLPNVTPVSDIDVDQLTKTFLAALGDPSPAQKNQSLALDAFSAGKADLVRVLAATNLDDTFCKALSYMVSIPKRPPTLAVLLAESARAIADTAKARHLTAGESEDVASTKRQEVLAYLEAFIAQSFGLTEA